MAKTLLVLGARSDIARATAYEFARGGFDIILAARDAESLQPVRSDLEIRHGISCSIAEFDAAAFGSHEEFYSSLHARPDVVLFAVGYLGEQKKAELDFDEAALIINGNYAGAVSILSVIANDFEARGQGAIIGISSVAGERGRQSNYFYGSAKAGLTAFLGGLRHRLAASGVNVITVKPGFVATRMTAGMDLPKRLTAEPEALGAAIFKAFTRRKHTVYFLPIWRLIMLAVRNVPEPIFLRTKL